MVEEPDECREVFDELELGAHDRHSIEKESEAENGLSPALYRSVLGQHG